jgi:hypothetical protein
MTVTNFVLLLPRSFIWRVPACLSGDAFFRLPLLAGSPVKIKKTYYNDLE